MIRIHNVYIDMLMGLANFLKNRTLHTFNIKGVEYNLGNVGLQTEYKTSYEMPRMIVNLTDSQLVNIRGNTFQFSSHNYNEQLVLYNRTKDLEILLQEDQYRITFDINISFNNILEAIDARHVLQNYTPIDKYLEYYKFQSFIELENHLIRDNVIDIHNDIVENLFVLYDKASSELKYCFGINYTPLVKFESITLDISDANAETFSITINGEMMTPFPSGLVYFKTSNQRPLTKIEKSITRRITMPCLSDKYNNIVVQIRNIKTNSTTEHIVPMKADSTKFSYQLFPEYKIDGKSTKAKHMVTFEGTYQSEDPKLHQHDSKYIKSEGYLYEDINKQIFYKIDFLYGAILGIGRKIVKIDDNTLSVLFTGMIDNIKYTDFRVTLSYNKSFTERIINNINIFDNEFKISKIHSINKSNIKSVYTKHILSLVNDINEFQMIEVKPTIEAIKFYYKNTNVETNYFYINCNVDKNGDFSFNIPISIKDLSLDTNNLLNENNDNETVIINVSGNFDTKLGTLKHYHLIAYNNIIQNFILSNVIEIFSMILNVEFMMNSDFGSSYIQNIRVDYNYSDATICTNLFDDFRSDDGINLIYPKLDFEFDNNFKKYNTKIQCYIQNYEFKNWEIYSGKLKLSSTDSREEFSFNKIDNFYNLSVSERLYLEYFKHINNTKPLILKLKYN